MNTFQFRKIWIHYLQIRELMGVPYLPNFAPLVSQVDADVPAALESRENPLGTNAAGTSASTRASEPVQVMAPAPAVVEAEAPPVVRPEPVTEEPADRKPGRLYSHFSPLSHPSNIINN